MDTVHIWTEGYTKYPRGKGSWAAMLDCNGTRKTISGKSPEDETTTNRMELLAMIEALKALKRPCKVSIVADSQYAIGVLSGGNTKTNADLVLELRELQQQHSIVWKWERELTTEEQRQVRESAQEVFAS